MSNFDDAVSTFAAQFTDGTTNFVFASSTSDAYVYYSWRSNTGGIAPYYIHTGIATSDFTDFALMTAGVATVEVSLEMYNAFNAPALQTTWAPYPQMAVLVGQDDAAHGSDVVVLIGSNAGNIPPDHWLWSRFPVLQARSVALDRPFDFYSSWTDGEVPDMHTALIVTRGPNGQLS